MKPYKVKNDLWFCPVQSQKNPDFDGFYFLYPATMITNNNSVKFNPKTLDEDSPYYAIINLTIFSFADKVAELKNAGFKHVYDIEKFKGDIWQVNGFETEFSYNIYANGIHLHLVISVLQQSYTVADAGASGTSMLGADGVTIPAAPFYPFKENEEITKYQGVFGGVTALNKEDGLYRFGSNSSFFCYTNSEAYNKVWKYVLEPQYEVPKDTIRVHKDIYLQNGAQIIKAETASEPLPPAHQISGDLWVLPCRQILDDGTEVVSDIYYQYPFKNHRYYDYDNDPFEVSNVSEYGDHTFSQCTVFTGSVKQYYGWNDLRLNSVKLRIKDTVVSLESYSDRYSISLRAKRPTDTNYHMITKYQNMQMMISGGTLFVKLSDTKICNSTYHGMINNDGTVSKVRLSKQEVTIPDDEEGKDFYNWLFDDSYIYDPPIKGIKAYKDIFLMGGAKILIDKKVENLKEAHRIRNDLWKLPCEIDGAEVAPNADGTRRPVEEIFFQYPYKRLGIAQFNKADEIIDNEFVNCAFFSDYAYPGTMRDTHKFPNCVRADWRGTWKIKDVENIQGSIYKSENVSLYTEYWGEEKQITLYYYGLKRPNDTEIHPIAVWVSGRYVLGSPYDCVGSLLVPVSQTMLHGTHFFNISSSASTVTPFYSFEINLEYNDVDGFYNWLFNGVFNEEEETTRLKIYKDIILMNGAKVYNEDGTEYTI